MGRGTSQDQSRQPRRMRTLILLAMLAMVTATVLSACASDPHQALAQQNKARLDRELAHAHALGIPDSMLQPIEKQEAKIANGEGGWAYDYQNAASNYALLYSQLVGVEQTATQTLQKQAAADIQAFANALQARQSQGFSLAGVYQQRLEQVEQQFSNAHTPGDFASVDTIARAQTEALQALWPAYQKLLDFQTVLKALGSSGIDAGLAQTEYKQDVQAFRAAESASRYQALEEVIDGQIIQLMADQSEGLPYIGNALLNSFQARITLLKSYGDSADAQQFQREHDADAKLLADARSLSDYQKLATTIDSQEASMDLPLIRGKAYADLAQYTAFVNAVYNNIKLAEYDPAEPDYTDGRALYEYELCPTNGIQDVTNTLNQAQTESEYQASDDMINILWANARAHMDDMRDKTPWNQPHATDLQLMQQFGVMQGRTMVVSLYEQVARFYENGKLVYETYVTTGRPELPSVPGLDMAMFKGTNLVFTSPEPKTSPFWYAPTPINYGILYANYGFFVHDGWWRTEFGPGTNLPHYDPAAFNGGSHGCVNLPLQNMAYVYSWLPLYAPIIVY
jgi:hypothetical protein